MEQKVSLSIIDSYFSLLKDNLKVDVAIAGGGPSGLYAAYLLAKKGIKTALYERKLAPGGGMWGGAMMFNRIFVQEEIAPVFDELGIRYEKSNGGLVADSVQATSALIYRAVSAGASIFNCYSIEDVILKKGRVSGIVVNWAPVHREGLHVDPLMIEARAVIDGTGHPCEIASILAEKNDVKLFTATGGIVGEMSLDMDEGERTTVENSGPVFPGLYVCGMAANGVKGSFRMGPIFGGMLKSGAKVAEIIMDELRNAD